MNMGFGEAHRLTLLKAERVEELTWRKSQTSRQFQQKASQGLWEILKDFMTFRLRRRQNFLVPGQTVLDRVIFKEKLTWARIALNKAIFEGRGSP